METSTTQSGQELGQQTYGLCEGCDTDEDFPLACLKGLRGFEQELMGLLDLFSQNDQDSSSTTHFDTFGNDSSHSFNDLEDLPVPDFMEEGTCSWTEFLMDEFPGNKIPPILAYDSSIVPSDFLAIEIGPQTSNSMQPSFPPSMFPPASEDAAQLRSNTSGLTSHKSIEAGNTQPNLSVHSLISQESSTSLAEIAQEAVQSEAGDAAVQSATNQAMGAETQANSETDPAAAKKAPKRKRVSKPKDPDAPKRKAGRPKVSPDFNILKHVRVFEQDGGLTMGEKAKTILATESMEDTTKTNLQEGEHIQTSNASAQGR